ncbi:zinc-binding alcohol dehydrogenase family protein [Pantoea sp. CCBC3-3-1]|uniref:zinc-binding alcohol dehydrogenase family protein n=1 Tax=Pantoea sp. CCBC3-3-1 TaxID=2490851 RepID=UPI0011BDD8B0|nr:zinc-binding alcohol dehydrogenase family protein [Pantoea sp. CCBC3-3-1]
MVSEMTTWVCEQPGSLIKKSSPIPQPAAGQALIRLRALGICGTDVHAFRGNQPMFDYPKIMGHEICGEVVKAADDVEHLPIGQAVIVIPYKHCGECYACQRGRITCCTKLSVMGVHYHGAMQEYVAVDAKQLLAVDDIDVRDAALIEPYAIGAHALARSGAKQGDTLLVVGAGAIGLGVADIASALGINIILAEVNEGRLSEACGRFGYLHALNPLAVDYAGRLKAITEGHGPGFIIDATGNAASMNSQVEHLAASGTIVFVGLHKGEISFNDLAFHKRETTMLASRAADIQDFEQVIALMATKRIHPELLRDNIFPFNELSQSAFSDMTQPKNIKTVIEFDNTGDVDRPE